MSACARGGSTARAGAYLCKVHLTPRRCQANLTSWKTTCASGEPSRGSHRLHSPRPWGCRGRRSTRSRPAATSPHCRSRSLSPATSGRAWRRCFRTTEIRDERNDEQLERAGDRHGADQRGGDGRVLGRRGLRGGLVRSPSSWPRSSRWCTSAAGARTCSR